MKLNGKREKDNKDACEIKGGESKGKEIKEKDGEIEASGPIETDPISEKLATTPLSS